MDHKPIYAITRNQPQFFFYQSKICMPLHNKINALTQLTTTHSKEQYNARYLLSQSQLVEWKRLSTVPISLLHCFRLLYLVQLTSITFNEIELRGNPIRFVLLFREDVKNFMMIFFRFYCSPRILRPLALTSLLWHVTYCWRATGSYHICTHNSPERTQQVPL